MADLDIKAASISTTLTGASTTGAESNYVNVTPNQDLQSADILNNSGTQAALTVGTTAVAVRAGGSNLTNRKSLTLHNNSLLTMYWGYTSGVTTSTGTPIVAGQFCEWSVGSGTTIYIITTLAGQNSRITEAA